MEPQSPLSREILKAFGAHIALKGEVVHFRTIKTRNNLLPPHSFIPTSLLHIRGICIIQ